MGPCSTTRHDGGRSASCGKSRQNASEVDSPLAHRGLSLRIICDVLLHAAVELDSYVGQRLRAAHVIQQFYSHLRGSNSCTMNSRIDVDQHTQVFAAFL